LHTVETAAILETLETQVRRGRRSMRKTILHATWPPLKQAYVSRIFVPGGDFGLGRTVHGQPAWTTGQELFGVVHGRVSFLRLSLWLEHAGVMLEASSTPALSHLRA
jgi:hypothetical protein